MILEEDRWALDTGRQKVTGEEVRSQDQVHQHLGREHTCSQGDAQPGAQVLKAEARSRATSPMHPPV